MASTGESSDADVSRRAIELHNLCDVDLSGTAETHLDIHGRRANIQFAPNLTVASLAGASNERSTPCVARIGLPSFAIDQAGRVAKLQRKFVQLLDEILKLSSSSHVAVSRLQLVCCDAIGELRSIISQFGNSFLGFTQKLQSMKEEADYEIELLSSIGWHCTQNPSVKTSVEDAHRYEASARLYVAFTYCNECLRLCVERLSVNIAAYEEKFEKLHFFPEIIEAKCKAEREALCMPIPESLVDKTAEAALAIQTYMRAYKDRHTFLNSCRNSTGKQGKSLKKKHCSTFNMRFLAFYSESSWLFIGGRSPASFVANNFSRHLCHFT